MTGRFVVCNSRDGFVLIAVLSVLALLSAIVVVLLGMSRDSVDAALLASLETRQEAMFQSALSLAAYELFQLGLTPERVNGQQFRLDEGTAMLTVTTDAGKIDLNASGKDLLGAAYVAAGLTALSPPSFAGRVIDWRDGDDKMSEEGAEALDYADAKLDYRPRDGAFRNIDDLRWVMGVSAADAEALRYLVTVYNPRGRLNSYAAPESVIRALPKVASETVEDVLAARAKPGVAASARLDDLLLVQASLIDTAPPVTYRVSIQIVADGAPEPRRAEAVIAAGAAASIPFHVLYWSGGR
jgi:general secretion pathway protein K